MRRLLALLLVLCLGVPAAAQGLSIEGGVGVGPYRLGGSFSAAKASLGQPDKVAQSSTSSDTTFYYYRSKGLLVRVKGDHINGLTVENPQDVVLGNLHVGSSWDDVIRRLGQPQTLHSDEDAYPEKGLTFTYDHQDHVQQVIIVEKDVRDPLQGDLVIEAGQRIGGVRIGMNLSGIISTWGQPDKSAPFPSDPTKNLLWFQHQGILIIAGDNQVYGVTTVSPGFGTPEGLRVGATRAAVYRVYGPHPTVVNGIDTYKSLGLGFTIENDKVTEITVLPR